MKTLWPTLILFIFAFSSFAQDFEDVQIKTHKITDNIYMLEGRGGNIGLCTGEDGTFVIDDQFAPLTDKIKTAISKITNDPVQFVINTHYHHDHVGGNENFGKEGAIIISHDNSREHIKADQLERMAEEGIAEFPEESLPIITFSETMTFHYNGETINIFHVDNAHTDGDVIIHFQDANVFHTGDVFVRYGFPYIDLKHGGNINGFIGALNKLALIVNEQTRIIPGHGQISAKKDIVELRDWLTEIRDIIKTQIDNGKSKEEIIALNPIKQLVDEDANIENIINTVYEGIINHKQ